MIDKRRSVLLTALVFTFAFSVGAVPDFPHTVNGENFEVSGGPFGDGEAYDGTVYAVNDGDSYGEVDISDGSFEDLLVQGLENGDEFNFRFNQIVVDETSVTFESGKVETVSDVSLDVDSLDADFSTSGGTYTDDTLEFDGSDSSGSTGVESYSWDFDDEDSASGVEVSHSFDEAREYDVSLTVEDEFGNQDVYSETFDIDSPPSSSNVNSGGNQEESEDDDQQDDQQEDEQGDDEQQDDQQDDQQEQDEQDDQQDQGDEASVREVDAEVDESGSASVSVESSEGETVRVNIPDSVDSDGSRVESVEVSSSASGTVSTSVRDVEEDEVENRRDDQVDFQEINVEGQVQDAKITFSVSKDVLEERNAGPDQVVKERFDLEKEQWQELNTSYLEELEDRHRFEAEVPEFSIFATSIREQEGSGLPWMLIVLAVLALVLGLGLYRSEDFMDVSSASDSESVGSDDIEFTDSEVEDLFDEAEELLLQVADDLDDASEIIEEVIDGEVSGGDNIEEIFRESVEERVQAQELIDQLEEMKE